MSTATSPISIRDQATAVITANLFGMPSFCKRLDELGGAVVAGLLVELETHFAIPLDVDEVLPDGTIGDLLQLACQRAGEKSLSARRGVAPAMILHWDDERARRALPMFAPIVAEPAPLPARPVELATLTPEAWDRADRAFARERSARYVLLALTISCTAGLAAGVVFWLQAPGGA